MSPTISCAFAIVSAGEGAAKRSSTCAALIFWRLPETASTCSEASLSARSIPAFTWPSSSNSTFMGCDTAEKGADCTLRAATHMRQSADAKDEHEAKHRAIPDNAHRQPA